jgi:hypothetical protein
MSTLDPHGMVTPYKINRPLSGEEEEHLLKVTAKASNRPHYELSLIRFNSTFVESVDKWFAMRGFVALGAGVGLLFLLAALAYLAYLSHPDDHLYFSPIYALWLTVIGGAAYLFFCDAFTYTHYPIRFNRKNRHVYVFRRNGTVLKAAWDSLYFTIYGHNTGFRDLYVVGHVLGDDRKTVKETFALSLTSAGRLGEERLKNHFEFFRRYMEDGPEAVLQAIKPLPLIMLPPLHQKRETWAFGWQRLTLHMNGWPVLMALYQVFAFPESFVRWLVMRSSKIPRWPEWVEQECAVEPGDPWVRDGQREG